jgi:hypothetical protein
MSPADWIGVKTSAPPILHRQSKISSCKSFAEADYGEAKNCQSPMS